MPIQIISDVINLSLNKIDICSRTMVQDQSVIIGREDASRPWTLDTKQY